MTLVSAYSSRERIRPLVVLTASMVLWLPHSRAQIPAPLAAPSPAAANAPAFDVISIRENTSGSGGMNWQTTDSAYIASNITAQLLLMGAYDMRSDQISGAPSWISTKHFDVQGKVVDPKESLRSLPVAQQDEMLRQILIKRFHLKCHIELREAPTYDLVLAKGGPKLKATPPSDLAHPEAAPHGHFLARPGGMEATAMPISQLANTLASQLERTVIDKTGLTGSYDYKITWSPHPETDVSDAAPNLFTALHEQLGLRLQPSRGPVQTLVIDHIDLPTRNDEE